MSSKSRRAKSSPYDEDEGPSVEVQALKQLRRRGNYWRWIVVVGVVAAVLALTISLRSYSSFTALTSYVTEQSAVSSEDKPGKQAAMQSVESWLSGSSSPFPKGADNLLWDGAVKVSETADSNGGASTVYWSHSFSFIDRRTGNTRRVSQLVAVKDDVSSPQGTPTVLPLSAIGTSSGSSAAPDGYPTLTQSDSLTSVIEAWAKAYVGNDSSALTVLVGDPDSNHAFLPAAVGEFDSASINWSVWAGDGKGENVAEGSKYGAASVTVSFKPTAAGDDSQQASTTITVLVKSPTSGAAKVVDWGADGSVSALRPYSHAVDKSLISGQTTTDSDTTGTTGTEDDSSQTEGGQ